MASRASRRLLNDFLLKRVTSIPVSSVRHCSSSSSSKIAPKIPHFSKKGRLLTGATIGLVIAGGAYVSTVDEATFCGWLFNATTLMLSLLISLLSQLLLVVGFRGRRGLIHQVLGLEVWGRKFSNPIGLAAGFDKNAEAIDGLLGLGFGFVEVGSVTPVPQVGNPKPRIFRLRQEGAIINRCGFNSEGIVAVAKRLGAQHGKRKLDETSSASSTLNNDFKHGGKAGPGILGVNLGKNKTSEDAASDYVQGVHSLSQYSDYLVINVSSPNTPGLRMLQGRKQLKDLVKKIQAARDEMQWGEEGPPPLLVKIAPDLSKEDLEDIAAVALALRLDGLIISNTTVLRPDSVKKYPVAEETGGLSGKPLLNLSTNILKEMFILTRGKIPLIGCGGVFSGEDAYKKIRAGATLVQLYTGFAYGGPALIPRIKAELAECLERDGFKSISEAVGADYSIRSSASTTTKKGTEAAPELSSRSLDPSSNNLLVESLPQYCRNISHREEEREEDLLGSSYYRSVERINDRLHRSSNCTYAPIYSDDLPASSSAFTQSSPKLLSPCSIPAPPWPKPPVSSSDQSQSSRLPATFLSRPSLFPPAPSTISSKLSPQATTLSFKSSPLPPPPSTSSSKSSHKDPNPVFHPSPSPKPLPSFLKPTTSSSKPSPTSRGPSSSSSKQLPSFKPTLSLASPNLIDGQTKVSYLLVQKDMSPIYAVPKDIEDLIKRGIVPEALNELLSPSTYKDYFAALLYAEDFYIEKWSKFKLENITLKLQDAAISKRYGRKEYFSESHEKDDKTFVEFEIDSCRERRPFLLSRDFALARPSGQKTEPYKGLIYRVVKNNIVLVEFGKDFYLQHHPTRKYDVSFSFNRVCLKRAHQAIEAASDPSFKNFLFPGFAHRKSIPTSTPLHFFNHKLDVCQRSAVQEILSFQGPAPYVVEGPHCSQKYSKQQSRTGYVAQEAGLSRTGLVVQEAVLQIYQRSSKHRILICAPINRTCDDLTQSLRKDIPESDMFRANAAFREVDGMAIDILTSCLFENDCFGCPSIQELRKFRVILSTFVSSFRLHNEGIVAGHFSHIFLVDASSATEPEAMVAMANLAGENTAVIVTGAPGNRSGWVRSNIAREKGLMRSYFERIRDSQPYRSLHPKFIKQLVDPERYYLSLWSTRMVVEFGGDFLLQHASFHPTYDASLPFNTVCFKKAHQAASDALFRSFLFPDHSQTKVFFCYGNMLTCPRMVTILIQKKGR
uniref:Dihydroorotate dehydrogenase (quinone), mitochondrial n=1 Tax=Salix viminalis TaxID=40686 RepID=A0A6N2M997_SALVM